MSEQDKQIERMAKISGGDGSRAPKYIVPLLKFNGNTGEFKIVDLENDKAETPVTKPVNIIVLKKRKVLSSFSTNVSYFTNEYNSPLQQVNLYKNIDGVVALEATDKPPFLREKYQALRTKQVLYVLFEGAVHKFEIKGGSQMDYFDYLNALNEEDLHTFQVVTSVNSVATKNDSGFAYFKMTFEKLEQKVDLDDVEIQMNAVNVELAKIDDYFAQKIAQDFRGAKSANISEPVINLDSDADKAYDSLGDNTDRSLNSPDSSYPKTNINPDDIPF